MQLIKNLLSALFGQTKKLPDDAILLDIRNHHEFEQGIIADSLLLPLAELNEEAERRLSNKNQPIVVYCASGVRAINAVRQLKQMGYSQVMNGGGIHHVAKLTNKPIIKP